MWPSLEVCLSVKYVACAAVFLTSLEFSYSSDPDLGAAAGSDISISSRGDADSPPGATFTTPYSLPFFWWDQTTSTEVWSVETFSPAELSSSSSSFLGIPPLMKSDLVHARTHRRETACDHYQIPVPALNSNDAALGGVHERSRRGDAGDLLRTVRDFNGFFQLGRDLGLVGGMWAELGVCQGKVRPRRSRCCCAQSVAKDASRDDHDRRKMKRARR